MVIYLNQKKRSILVPHIHIYIYIYIYIHITENHTQTNPGSQHFPNLATRLGHHFQPPPHLELPFPDRHLWFGMDAEDTSIPWSFGTVATAPLVFGLLEQLEKIRWWIFGWIRWRKNPWDLLTSRRWKPQKWHVFPGVKVKLANVYTHLAWCSSSRIFAWSDVKCQVKKSI